MSDNNIGGNLESIKPEKLASLVSEMEHFKLCCSSPTPQQSDANFLALNGNTQMKSFDMRGTNLSSMNPNILADAISHIDEVIIKGTELTGQQATHLC